MLRTLFALLLCLFLIGGGSTAFAHTGLINSESTPKHACGDLWYVDISLTAKPDAHFDVVVTTKSYCGYLVAFHVDPGTPGPTNDADLDLFHTVAGVAVTEMLGAQGDNIIDNINNNYVTLSSKIAVCGPLGIDMENNGVNIATFVLRLYFEIPGSE